MTQPNHTNIQRQPAFPLVQAVIALTGAMAVMGWLAHTWLPKYLESFDSSAVNAALMLVWCSSLISVAPVAALGSLGVMPTVWGYFMGMGMRMLVCLGAYLFLLFNPVVPSYPFAVVMVATYLPTLFIEVALVARYLWLKDALPAQPPLEMAT